MGKIRKDVSRDSRGMTKETGKYMVLGCAVEVRFLSSTTIALKKRILMGVVWTLNLAVSNLKLSNLFSNFRLWQAGYS